MRRDQMLRKTEIDTKQPDDLQTLNFKVSSDFKRAFKVYAAQNGISMLDLLREGFELSKRERGNLK